MEKRFVMILLLVLFCASLFCAASAEIVDSGTCGANGDDLTWTLDDEGLLTISGAGEMADFSWAAKPWGRSVKQVIIEKGVTSIGSDAFSSCSDLTNVTIPNSVVSIRREAFGYSASLTNLIIPNSVKSIGGNAFSGCTSLTSVIIPDSVTSIGSYAFSWCSSLTSLTISANLSTMGDYAFDQCKNLQDILFRGSVANMGQSVFRGCPTVCAELDSVTARELSKAGAFFRISGKTYSLRYDYSDNTIIGLGLGDVDKDVKSFNIPDGIIRIEPYAFSGCSDLTSVTIPGSVTSIGYGAFMDCDKLEGVVIPENVTNIEFSAFSGCTNLTQVSIPEGVTQIGRAAFVYCSSLTSVSIPGSVMSIDASAFNECSNLTNVIIGDGVTSIGDYAFLECKSGMRIVVPGTVTDIGKYAFLHTALIQAPCKSPAHDYAINYGTCFEPIHDYSRGVCSRCGHVDGQTDEGAPDFVIRDGVLLAYTGDDENVAIPGEVTRIDTWAFSYCDSVQSVTIPDSVTNIGEGAFEFCSNLMSVTIPSSVTVIEEYAFGDCHNLTNLTISEGVEEIYYFAFCNCTGLTSVTIPESINWIGRSAFAGCDCLERAIILGKDTDIYDYALPESAAIYCYKGSAADEWGQANGNEVWYLDTDSPNLKTLDVLYLPTGLISTEEEAFMGAACQAVVCSDGLTAIGARAFADCKRLRIIYIPASCTTISKTAFDGCSEDLVIFGAEDSVAEMYAQLYGYTFIKIE